MPARNFGRIAELPDGDNVRRITISLEATAARQRSHHVKPPTDLPSILVDELDAPVVRPRWRVAISLFLAALAFLVLVVCALAVHGCTSPNTGKPRTGAEVLVEVRKLEHSAAVTYCTGHNFAEPLIILGEGVWPPLRLPNVIANAFCDHVAAAERERTRPLGWVLDPNGFDEIPAPGAAASP
jgi:hypothetical protein